jgi:hypothetical protein
MARRHQNNSVSDALSWGASASAAPHSHPAPRRVNPQAAIDEQRYLASLLEPAGAPKEACTTNMDYDMVSAHEMPHVGGGRKTAFAYTQYQHAQPVLDGTGLDYEKERRVRAREREEANLYQAVQPGNDLNRHVTGDTYARQMMQEFEQKQAEEAAKKEADLRVSVLVPGPHGFS